MSETSRSQISQPSLAAVTAPRAARIAMISTPVFVALLALLHLIEPEYAPSWRLVSEYANGTYGWVMTLAFLTLALSFAALFAALRPHIRGFGGRSGLFVLAASAISLVGAALFPIDPITSSPADGTITGMLHALVSMVGIPGTALAAALIAWGLFKNKAWNPARPALLATTILIWLATAGIFLAIGLTMPADGTFSPAVLVGWPNRILILTWCVWALALARRAAR